MYNLAAMDKEALSSEKIQAIHRLNEITGFEQWQDDFNQLIIGYLSSKSIQEDGDTPDADLIFRIQELQKIIKALVE